MKLSLPQNIYSIISIINNGGFSAHIVGGCVRDMLLGRLPKDWDITTNAAPDKIKALFEKTYDTGLKHGTVTVSYMNTLVEVTTWRKETRYSDHRRPDKVIYTESLSEDLKRRDFTMNAIAYHPDEGLFDPYNGFDAIKHKIIKCVGEPAQRFSEDALRMLRAIRFSAQLNFAIEEDTLNAIKALYSDLSYVSTERIQTEVSKILDSGNPQKLGLLWETGLSGLIFPEIASLSPEWSDISLVLAGREHGKAILLGLLFLFSFEQNPERHAVEMLKRLKFDNETTAGVTNLIKGLCGLGPLTSRNIRRLVTEYGDYTASLVFETLHALKRTDRIAPYDIPYSSIKPAVSGIDLKEAGLCKGREIGILLSALTLCLYEKPQLNDYETLMYLAETISDKFK